MTNALLVAFTCATNFCTACVIRDASDHDDPEYAMQVLHPLPTTPTPSTSPYEIDVSPYLRDDRK